MTQMVMITKMMMMMIWTSGAKKKEGKRSDSEWGGVHPMMDCDYNYLDKLLQLL